MGSQLKDLLQVSQSFRRVTGMVDTRYIDRYIEIGICTYGIIDRKIEIKKDRNKERFEKLIMYIMFNLAKYF